MQIPRLPARPWVAVAAVVAAAAILLTVVHQGNANADTGPPDTPGNPLAHLIVPSNEDPRIRLSWGRTRHAGIRLHHHQNRRPGVPSRRHRHHVLRTTRWSREPRTPTPSRPTAPMAPAHPLNQPPRTSRTRPSAPGNLTGAVAEPEATDETATVNLMWLASTVPAPDQCDTAYPLTGYTIVRSDGDQETELGTADAGATSFNDSTAAFSRQYTYRVTARNAIGASSSETSVTLFSQPVLPPTELTAAIADPFDGNVSLSWDAPTAGAEHRRLLGTPVPGTRSLRRDRHTRHPRGSNPRRTGHPDRPGGRHRRGGSRLLLPGHSLQRGHLQPAVQHRRHRGSRPTNRPDRHRGRRRHRPVLVGSRRRNRGDLPSGSPAAGRRLEHPCRHGPKRATPTTPPKPTSSTATGCSTATNTAAARGRNRATLR